MRDQGGRYMQAEGGGAAEAGEKIAVAGWHRILIEGREGGGEGHTRGRACTHSGGC